MIHLARLLSPRDWHGNRQKTRKETPPLHLALHEDEYQLTPKRRTDRSSAAFRASAADLLIVVRD
jgi:hypothetical protein